MTKFISILFLLTCSHSLYAQDIPDFSANYLVKLNGLQAGELKRSLSTNDDGSRLFTSQSQAKGLFSFFKPDLVEESSLWLRHNNVIRPINYLYQRTGGKKEKYMQLSFDWNKRRVHIDDKKHPWSLELADFTLDKLVYQLALMSDLANDKTNVNYQIADGGKLKLYEIKLLGQEVITTPLGKINTFKLTRHRDKPNDRQTTLWCAPSLNYLPVMLEHTEKGGAIFTAVLRTLKGIDTSSAFEPLKPKADNKMGLMP